MVRSGGKRSNTRYLFQRGYRQNGAIPLSVYLTPYKVGDYVDIKANAAVQQGMPHKFYHGKTGKVWTVMKRAVGVEVNKQVRLIDDECDYRINQPGEEEENTHIVCTRRVYMWR